MVSFSSLQLHEIHPPKRNILSKRLKAYAEQPIKSFFNLEIFTYSPNYEEDRDV